MTHFLRKQGVHARSIAALACGVLLMQMIFAGFAAASVEGGAGADADVSCGLKIVSSGGDAPAAPHTGHQHGACCILHSVALNAPDIRSVSAVVLAFPNEVVVFTDLEWEPSHLFEPESAPQSPRAPPSVST